MLPLLRTGLPRARAATLTLPLPLRLTLSIALAACGDKGDSGAIACEPGAAEAGHLVGELDGAAYDAPEATWTWSGENLQINTATHEGWHMTVVGKETDGGSVKAAADAGDYPIEVKLSDAGGGFALAYPASGSTYTSDAGGGSLVFTEIGAEAVGCVSFEASDGSETVTLSGGAFRAVAF
jgi:hypothetical protein